VGGRMAHHCYFAKLFFPTGDPVIGTPAALGTLGVGYVARPIGAAVFGHFVLGRVMVLVLALAGVLTLGIIQSSFALAKYEHELSALEQLVECIDGLRQRALLCGAGGARSTVAGILPGLRFRWHACR
jgi:hypothetical protein